MDYTKVKAALSGKNIGLVEIDDTPIHAQYVRQVPAIARMAAVRTAIAAVDTLDFGSLPAEIEATWLGFGPAASKAQVYITHSEAAGTCEITPVLFIKSSGLNVPFAVLAPQTFTAAAVVAGSIYHSPVLSWDVPAGIGIGFLISALSTSNVVTVYAGVNDQAWTGYPMNNHAPSSLGFSYLDSVGRYHGWGENGDYQQNPNDSTDPCVSTDVILAGPYIKMSRGEHHTLLLDTAGNVYGFGFNGFKQVNPASATDPWVDETYVIATGCIDIAAGGAHSLALKANGDVVAWGRNNSNQANPASATDPWVDQATVIVSGCTAVYAGQANSFAIKANGDVVGWGDNAYKQIQNSDTDPWIDTSTIITGSITSVGVGRAHTVFLKSNGDVVGIGENPFADPDSTDGWLSIDITRVLFTGVSAIDCAYQHTVLLKDGAVYVYGNNAYQQSNPKSVIDPWIDTALPVVSEIMQICASQWSTYAIDSAGRYYGWGRNKVNDINPLSVVTPWIDTSVILTLG